MRFVCITVSDTLKIQAFLQPILFLTCPFSQAQGRWRRRAQLSRGSAHVFSGVSVSLATSYCTKPFFYFTAPVIFISPANGTDLLVRCFFLQMSVAPRIDAKVFCNYAKRYSYELLFTIVSPWCHCVSLCATLYERFSCFTQ